MHKYYITCWLAKKGALRYQKVPKNIIIMKELTVVTVKVLFLFLFFFWVGELWGVGSNLGVVMDC